jgi:hypothetical protein
VYGLVSFYTLSKIVVVFLAFTGDTNYICDFFNSAMQCEQQVSESGRREAAGVKKMRSRMVRRLVVKNRK